MYLFQQYCKRHLMRKAYGAVLTPLQKLGAARAIKALEDTLHRRTVQYRAENYGTGRGQWRYVNIEWWYRLQNQDRYNAERKANYARHRTA